MEKLSVSELLNRYAANQDNMKSLIAKTEVIWIPSAEGTSDQEPQQSRSIAEFRYEDTGKDFKAYYCKTRFKLETNGTWVEEKSRSYKYLWRDKLYHEYYRGPRLEVSNLYVTSDPRFAAKEEIRYEGSGSFRGVLCGDIERIDSILRKSDSLSVRSDLDLVGSVECYVRPEDLSWGRPRRDSVDNSIEVLQNVRFECVNGIWSPMEFEWLSTEESKDRTLSGCTQYKVTYLDVSPDHNDLGSFRLDIQDGTEVRINDAPGIALATEYTWQDGMKFVLDERAGRTRYVPKDWSIKVGVGKPLPKLEGIGISLTTGQTKNRAILICFFDMQQRPSRYCITQLAKQAKQLKEKGVIVVAVQASKVDESKLNDWVKKYNIPFPVGMMEGDAEKISFTWGVRSLPWLILTDKQHIVRAEGFGFEELDEEIKKTKVTPPKQAASTNDPGSTKSFLDAEAILARWESSYAGIRTMRVFYCTRLADYRPPAKKPDINMTDLVKYQHVERVEQESRFHIRCSAAKDGFAQPDSITEAAFDGKITREYSARDKHGSIVAGLIGRNTEMMNDVKVYMLLRRRLVGGRNESGTYLIEDPNSKPELSRMLSSAITRSTVSVLPDLELVGGQLCHVIEVVLPGRDHRGIPRQIKQVFWMAHDKGMCLMRYQWYWDKRLDREIQVKQIAMTDMDGAEIWYPEKAYRTLFDEELGTMKYELMVTDFVPNVEVDENTFRFDFPAGTYVFNRLWGIAGVDLPEEPASLVGKPLPELRDFGVKLNADQLKGKMILLCFWDMEQRAARNCIRALAKRADELKEKGVTVITVQASKIDENKLNEWAKKYNIPFPVGMMEGDAEKTRFTWGVRSLPWLIPTDKQHVATAEGLTVPELEQKLNSNSNH
jgi:hypothetical protein